MRRRVGHPWVIPLLTIYPMGLPMGLPMGEPWGRAVGRICVIE